MGNYEYTLDSKKRLRQFREMHISRSDEIFMKDKLAGGRNQTFFIYTDAKFNEWAHSR